MIDDFLLIILLILINGLFSLADYSISRFNSFIEDQKEKSRFGFKTAGKISDNYQKYERTINVGYLISLFAFAWLTRNIIIKLIDLSFINSLISEESFLFDYIRELNLLIFFFTGFLIIIIFGKMLPEVFAKNNIVLSARLSSPIIIAFHIIVKPFVYLLGQIYNFFIWIFGFKLNKTEENQVIQDEIRYLIEESSKLSELDEAEKTIVENVFEFSNTSVSKILTPRNKISAIEINDTKDEIFQKILNDGYSRYPVYKDNIDIILGILNVKDLLVNKFTSNEFNILEIIRKPVFVDENEPIDELLKKMKSQKVHFAVVQDSFNGTTGIITMEDIIEELIGDIQDEYDEEQKNIEKINDNEYCIIASVSIDELNDILSLDLPTHESYKSLGGLILYESGTIPEINEVITIRNYRFTVIKGTKRKIEILKLEILEQDNKEL